MPVIPEAIASPVLAFCVAAFVMPLLNGLAVKTGFVDHPNARKIHDRPIPLLGGLGVYAGVIATLLLRGQLDSRVWMMMLASFLVMALGIADDRLDLPSRYRLMLHALLAAGLSLSGVRFHFFPVEALDHLFTILWIVGTINAMNCLDCADGAAGGTSLVAFIALAALAAYNGRLFVFQVSLAGAGAVAGFLLYNVPPARVFMGDTGSTFIGLMMAVLAILATKPTHGAWQLPWTPFILSVPVFDIAWVHYRRYRAGITSVRELLSSTGKDHLPHRLMARGLSKTVAMAVVALLTAFAALGAYSVAVGLWTVAAMAIISLVALMWHLEEHAEVVLRSDDRVAIYRPKTEVPSLSAAMHPEESVA